MDPIQLLIRWWVVLRCLLLCSLHLTNFLILFDWCHHCHCDSPFYFFFPPFLSFYLSLFVCLYFLKNQVEKTIRNGYKTTQLQLSASLQEISSRIQSLMGPLGKLVAPDIHCWLIENNNAIKSITLYRQCERFLHDLLITLTDHQIYIDRCLKGFRSQLNKIHETVKFRTAIPITSIFVSIPFCWVCLQHLGHLISKFRRL